VADDHHDAGPAGDGVVQPAARVDVEVVARLVEQDHIGPPQEERGQRGHDGLTAG
jgi:hypothetical protein